MAGEPVALPRPAERPKLKEWELCGRLPGYPEVVIMEDLRETPRLLFPADLGAAALFARGEHRIMDCGPGGMRIALNGPEARPRVGDRIAGSARFGSGTEIPFVGRVVWTTSREIGLELDPPGIPTHIIDSSLETVAKLV